MSKHLGRVLTIAGSDSSGGAGIQADIKAITALGGYGMSAITALTAQNTQGVLSIQKMQPPFLISQAEACLSDIGADCIKTGMLADQAIVEAVIKLTQKYKTIPLVVDPVMVATSGDLLLEKDSISILIEKLFSQALLVTPNIPEAELLAHILISNTEGMIKAGEKIIEKSGCQAVLVKGGHLKGEKLTDILVTKQGDIKHFESARIDTKNTHGTGCTLASAIATYIARGLTLTDAIEKSCHYVHQSIKYSQGFGKGNGPLHHGWHIPPL